jgi:hypothetical protein
MQFPAHGAVMALSGLLAAGKLAPGETWDLAALRAFAGFSADQWNTADHGDPQVRVLDTKEKREVDCFSGVIPQRAISGGCQSVWSRRGDVPPARPIELPPVDLGRPSTSRGGSPERPLASFRGAI